MHRDGLRKRLVLRYRVRGIILLTVRLSAAFCHMLADMEMVFCLKVRQRCPHIAVLCVGRHRCSDQFCEFNRLLYTKFLVIIKIRNRRYLISGYQIFYNWHRLHARSLHAGSLDQTWL